MKRACFSKIVLIAVMLIFLRSTISSFMKEVEPVTTFQSDRTKLKNYIENEDPFYIQSENSSDKCLGCHDGIIASDSHMSPGESSSFQGPFIGMSHPVAINYSPTYNKNPARYIHPQSISPEIRLFDDKIECLSCHNKDSNIDHYLVMNNRGSRLCLSCHNL